MRTIIAAVAFTAVFAVTLAASGSPAAVIRKTDRLALPLPPLMEVDHFQVIGKALLVKRCPVLPDMDPTGQLCHWRFAEI